MISNLEFQFDPRDAAEREAARRKFLKAFLKTAKAINKIFEDQGEDDPFLELMQLQRAWIRFQRHDRPGLLEPDMRDAKVGPVNEVLFFFNGLLRPGVLENYQTLYEKCSAKIKSELEKETVAV
jgi:hypothetical protein